MDCERCKHPAHTRFCLMSDCWCWNDPGRTDDRDAELARLRIDRDRLRHELDDRVVEHEADVARLRDRLAAVERELVEAREERDCAAGWAEVNDDLRRQVAALTRAKAEADQTNVVLRERIEDWSKVTEGLRSALATSRTEAVGLRHALEECQTWLLAHGAVTMHRDVTAPALASSPDAAATLALVRAVIEAKTAYRQFRVGAGPRLDEAIDALAARFGSGT